MALRDKLRARVQPLLEPGEQIQSVFLAQAGPDPNLVFLTYLIYFFAKYYVVAVTDRAVVVCRAGLFTQTMPKAVAERLPRNTPIGPARGGLWSKLAITGNGKNLWVHRRFYKDVEAAESASTAA